MTLDIHRPPRIRPAWMSAVIEVAAQTVVCVIAIGFGIVVVLALNYLLQQFR